jgi:hypothetical protein
MAATTPKSTEIEFARQMTLRGLGGGAASVTASEAAMNTIQEAVATLPAAQQALTEAQEMAQLKQVIVSWRELESEATVLNAQIREKKKRQKALEEIILRIMKKHNIGALDLKGSGGRLLYRRQTTKEPLNVKTLTTLLTSHLKSETAATDALKYIHENRGAKVRESILYEKE